MLEIFFTSSPTNSHLHVSSLYGSHFMGSFVTRWLLGLLSLLLRSTDWLITWFFSEFLDFFLLIGSIDCLIDSVFEYFIFYLILCIYRYLHMGPDFLVFFLRFIRSWVSAVQEGHIRWTNVSCSLRIPPRNRVHGAILLLRRHPRTRKAALLPRAKAPVSWRVLRLPVHPRGRL